MKNTYNFGVLAETIICVYLFFRGYRILTRRFKCKVGEVDIIASKAKNITFFEVKARSIKTTEVITSNQMKRISDASKYYLAKNSGNNYDNYFIDLIIYNPPLTLKHIRNAWNFFE